MSKYEENESTMEMQEGVEFDDEQEIDLGSSEEEQFDPFGQSTLEDELQDGENSIEESEAEKKEKQAATKPPATEKKDKMPKQESSVNPMETMINAVEEKNAEAAQVSLFAKPPVFEYGGITEPIEDAEITFDELRIDKAVDFPELDDSKRVSWTVEYGKTVKSITNVKGTTIASVKSEIETSKEFLDSLKKSKDKNPNCKVKARVTAQTKGRMSVPYKGVYTTQEEALQSGKLITIFPAKDGKVYEMRNTELGSFTTYAGQNELLDDVAAGFIPALPLIPSELLMQIISFFRNFMTCGKEYEALVNIYWDKEKEIFIAAPPQQTISKASVETELGEEYPENRYIHYLDIHSHNSMKAFFSFIDDRDEKATRLYMVIGRLDKILPDIKIRISNGGKFLAIDPGIVFEGITSDFPSVWLETVNYRDGHSDMDKNESDTLILNQMKNFRFRECRVGE